MYNTDRVALQTMRCLISDFRRFHGPQFAAGAEMALNSGIVQFREYKWPSLGLVDPHRFKCQWQLENWWKRHIFVNDVYSRKDLESATSQKFLDNQVRLATQRPHRAYIQPVLAEARRICRAILGEFDMEACISYMKIGGKATIGNPRRKAFLDEKLGDPMAFTCPSRLRREFFNSLEQDRVLSRIVKDIFRKKETLPLATDSLAVVLVSKSWKSLRPITPLSLIGLYWSYGLGGLVTERLKNFTLDGRKFSLNIRRLQAKHRRLVKSMSEDREHATADLSSASDSLVRWLLNCVLPRRWYNELKKTFVDNLEIDGKTYHASSVLPMGNVATFPVETLIFYCLIKAIGNLLRVRGIYSVYGDDLIYPSKIHSYVVRVFESLGLLMNVDKTFVSSHFRESCGSDFYRGFDVRPALLPEADEDRPIVGRLRYLQHLYKVLNSLLARWDRLEIPDTVKWLELEILSYSREILQVPRSYPPTSGLQSDNPIASSWWMPRTVFKYGFRDGCGVVTYAAILEMPPSKRAVVSTLPYYWDWLRAASLDKDRKHPIFSPIVYVSQKGKTAMVALTPEKIAGKPKLVVVTQPQ